MEEASYQLAANNFGPEEVEAATAVLRSGYYTMGAKVREFEAALAKWMGVKHVLMVNSGSSSNLLLIDTLLRRYQPGDAPLKPGDEVLVPALAWPTTVWPIMQLGLTPVYVDIDPKTLAISLESAQKALSPKTKAMFLIHVLGRACEMKAYQDFCKQNGMVLLEDCCESFGAFDRGQHVGSFGWGGTFSHYFSHHLTTTEGGTICTNDDALADDLRSIRAHGWSRDRSDTEAIKKRYVEFDPRFLFVMPGYNVRPTEMQAAIGLVQLKRMDDFFAKREWVAREVSKLLNKYTPWMGVIGADLLNTAAPKNYRERRHSWMSIPILLTDKAPCSVEKVKAALEAHRVETRPIIAGNLARHPANRYAASRSVESLAVSDLILRMGFMIGCHSGVNDASMGQLEKALKTLK